MQFRETLTGKLRAGVGRSSMALALSFALMPGAALAQAAPADQPAPPVDEHTIATGNNGAQQPAKPDDKDTIVVTGTLVRGIAPPGTNVIGVTRQDIQATGAVTTAQLLQTIPQLNTFNSLEAPLNGGNNLTVNRPSLRGLDSNTAGGTTTLMLLDGHRFVGAGVVSTGPDPDVIPPGAIERVEVVPDGGSAIYGSDAVAGVINFITRRRFDGVQVDGHYGIADNYRQWDVNATAGTTWGSGGFYLSYNYAQHSNILGADRDFVHLFPVQNGSQQVLDLRCSPGNVQNLADGTIYALPNLTANTNNSCDPSQTGTFYPRERRHSLFAALSQDITDKIKLDVHAFYTDRKTDFVNGPFRSTLLVTPFPIGFGITSPYAFGVFFGTGAVAQDVSFEFGANNASSQSIRLKEWGVTPTLTADLGGTWQLRLLGTLGQSVIVSQTHDISPDALNNAIESGVFNPYDPTTASPDVLAAIGGNFGAYGYAKQRLADFRAVADGDLFELPGGPAKLALGVEWYRESRDAQNGSTIVGYQNTGYPGATVAGVVIPSYPAIPLVDLHREVKAAFGELVVPIFGKANAVPGIDELTFSLAGRYDDYSDVGHTFNPKVGLTYKPVNWLKFRGSWGKSFNAPSLADSAGAAPASLIFVPAGVFYPAAADQVPNGKFPVPNPGTEVGVLFGNAPGITPQKANTLSLGFDVQPPVIPGLDLGVTYYRINFQDQIGDTDFFEPAFYEQFASLATVVQGSANPAATLAPFLAGFPVVNYCGAASCVYAVIDGRKRNLGKQHLRGLDFNANYSHPTSFGSVHIELNANYQLTRESQVFAGAPWHDDLANNLSKFGFRTRGGVQVGNFLADVIWSHTGGYSLLPAVGLIPQTRVGAYNVFDLFFKYDVNGHGFTKNLSFTANVNNVFDKDPPVYRGTLNTAPGFINGSTLGRLFQIGVSEKF